MSFLALIIKPLAYISVPIILLRTVVASASPVSRYYAHLTIYVGTLVVVSTLGVFVAVGMTLVGHRQDATYVIARSFYAIVSRVLDIKIDIEGEEHLQTKPMVMVSNHQSIIDILCLGRFFPRQASILAKKELLWTPLGPWMFITGAVFVDRGNSTRAHQTLAAAGETMKAKGISLMIYPEGTRHLPEVPSLLPFKKGAFQLAVQAGLPIIPIISQNYWKIYHKGVFETGTIKIRVLPPIPTTGLTGSDVAELTTRVRNQMLSTLREMSGTPISEEETEAIEEARVEESDFTPATAAATPDETMPDEVPDSESSSEAPSVDTPTTLSSRHEGQGSAGEYGTETDDEGMVVVGRQYQ